MEQQRPLILVCNDDSVDAPGLLRLVDCLPEEAEVYVVAPLYPQSAKSSALTVMNPLRIKELPSYKAAKMYAVDGTPVDCVKMALFTIVPRRPDLVLAGINHGSNAGINVLYSGTMGAVMEGCMSGICSCGFSLMHHSMKADFGPGMPFVKQIVEKLLRDSLPDGVCLNVNIPAMVSPVGVKVCRAARGYWTNEYEKYLDPAGKPFYMLTGRFVNAEPDSADTDEYWLARNYISVVPVAVDMTAQASVSFLAKRFDHGK